MKITIAYTADEATKALTVLGIIRDYLPDTTVHKSERHPPYTHLYVSTKRPGNPSQQAKNA